jgi:hypothetical protein
VHPIGQRTNISRPDGAAEHDGVLKVVVRKKIIHSSIVNYTSSLHIDHPEPIAFMPVEVDTSARISMMMTFFVYYSCMLTVKHRI